MKRSKVIDAVKNKLESEQTKHSSNQSDLFKQKNRKLELKKEEVRLRAIALQECRKEREEKRVFKLMKVH